LALGVESKEEIKKHRLSRKTDRICLRQQPIRMQPMQRYSITVI